MEIGSDIGGSIRNPAHLCGVFGHKATWGIISDRGHIPGPPGQLAPTDLGVMGPLALSAQDLTLALVLLAGADPPAPPVRPPPVRMLDHVEDLTARQPVVDRDRAHRRTLRADATTYEEKKEADPEPSRS